MASVDAPHCVSCLVALPKDTQRRRLSTPAHEAVLPVLEDIVLSLYPSSCLLHFGIGNSKAVTCKPCFSKLEQILKQRRKELELKKALAATIGKTGECLGLQQSTQACRQRTGPFIPGSFTPLRPTTSLLSPGPSTPSRPGISPTQHDTANPTSRKRSNPVSPSDSYGKKRPRYDTPERQAIQQTISQRTPAVSVLVKRRQGARVFQLTRSLKRMGRSIGRCNRGAIARTAVQDQRICDKLVPLLGKKMRKEMQNMCRVSTNSILREKDPTLFDIEAVVREMDQHAPITKSLLEGCLSGRRKSTATELKNKGRTKSRMIPAQKVVGVCCALLLRARSQRMNALQRVVSLILYCGHASKRVSFIPSLGPLLPMSRFQSFFFFLFCNLKNPKPPY